MAEQVDLTTLMLHTKSKGHLPIGSADCILLYMSVKVILGNVTLYFDLYF